MLHGKYVANVVNNNVTGQPIPYDPGMMQTSGSSHPIGWGITAFIAVVIIIYAVRSMFIVNQQSVAIIEKFGKFKKVATAGLNFKNPFFDRIVSRTNLRRQELAANVDVKSSDNAFVQVPVKVQWQIIPEKAKEAYYSLQNIGEQLTSYIMNTVRSTGTTMTMEEIFQNKDKFDLAVKETLDEKFSEFGVLVVNVLVDNPIPSPAVSDAFNRVIASKRLQEAAQNEAEAIRVKTVGLAKAEAESLTLKATAYVEQRKTIAEGMEDIMGSNAGIMDYLVGIDWRDTIREASQKGNLIIVPSNYDGSQIAMTKAALKPDPQAAITYIR